MILTPTTLPHVDATAVPTGAALSTSASMDAGVYSEPPAPVDVDRRALVATPLPFEDGDNGEKPTHDDYVLVPSAGYSSDTGWLVGAGAAWYRRAPGERPYRYAAVLVGSATTRGVQQYTLKLDAPGALGPRLRPFGSIGFMRDKFRPYYGLGNESEPDVSADPFHQYALDAASLTAGLDWTLRPGLRLVTVYDLRALDAESPAGTLLAADRPEGPGGDRAGRLDVELLRDTRDDEASTTRGSYTALSAHAAGPALGGSDTYGGVAAEWRGFTPLWGAGSRLVAAARLMGHATWGTVPVAQVPLFGGRSRVEGLGGSGSIRGLPRYLYTGQAKVLGNLELRSRLWRWEPWSRPLDLWVAAFVDTGRAWAQPGDPGWPWELHWGAGGGVRVAWVESFVVRLDAGWSEGRTAFYATLDQPF